jgi:hypothetical protein
MNKSKIEKLIEAYKSSGFSRMDAELDSFVICPSGGIYSQNVLTDSCPICAQNDEDGEDSCHFHDDAVLKEALRAKRFYYLVSDLERIHLGEEMFRRN